MNRRDFIKFMSVTPAVAAASNVLAKTKGADSKIELLEPKSLILPCDNDTIVFDNVISYNFDYDNNLCVINEIPNFNRITASLSAKVYVSDINGNPMHGITCYQDRPFFSNYSYFEINIPELSKMKFAMSTFSVNATYDEIMTADVIGVRIL